MGRRADSAEHETKLLGTAVTAPPAPHGAEGEQAPRKRRPYLPRSKDGCLVCRVRKKKCDKQHPICNTCKRLNLPCCYPKGRRKKCPVTRAPSTCSSLPGEQQHVPAEVEQESQHGVDADMAASFATEVVLSEALGDAADDSQAREQDEMKLLLHNLNEAPRSSLELGDDERMGLSKVDEMLRRGPMPRDTLASVYDEYYSMPHSNLDDVLAYEINLTKVGLSVDATEFDSVTSASVTDSRRHSLSSSSSPLGYLSDAAVNSSSASSLVSMSDGSQANSSSSPTLSSKMADAHHEWSSSDRNLEAWAARRESAASNDSDLAMTSRLMPVIETLSEYPAMKQESGIGGDNINDKGFSSSPGKETHTPEDPSVNADFSKIKLSSEQSTILMDYYVQQLTRKISVCPDVNNFFVCFFLPLARRDKGVMMSVLAWSSVHLTAYQSAFRPWAKALIARANQLFDESVNNEASCHADTTLASALIMCAIEICRGGRTSWMHYHRAAGDIVQAWKKENGSLSELKDTPKSTMWLLQNYLYHDLLCSTTFVNGPSLSMQSINEILSVNFGIDSYMGCCKAVFALLAEISALRARMNTMSLTDVAAESLKLEQRLIDVQCNVHADLARVAEDQVPAYMAAHQVFQAAGRIYMHQMIHRMNAACMSSQALFEDTLTAIAPLVHHAIRSSLLFPLFVLGVDAVKPTHRQQIMDMFVTLYDSSRIGNIRAVQSLLQQVWEENCNGERWVDWCVLIQQRGWELSFA